MRKHSLLVLAISFLLMTITEALAKRSYLIQTKDHTPLETFHTWTQKLDGNSGIQIAHAHVDHQSYVTELTPAEAEEVKQTDFIQSVYEQGEPRTARNHRAVPNSQLDHRKPAPRAQSSRKSPLEQRTIVNQVTLSNQKRLISWNQRGRPPVDTSYLTDGNEGNGVDIYVIDSGFNVDLEELSGRPIKPVTYFVSNSIVAPAAEKDEEIYKASIEDHGDHGTMMAILAGGKTLGIAPKSGLYLLKASADVKGADGKVKSFFSPASIKDVTDKIISNIRANPSRKAVVSVSEDVLLSGGSSDDSYKNVYQTFITKLDELGVTLVIPTGNNGLSGETTADAVPQCLGTPQNNVITIGGLNYDGTLWIKTTTEGRSGSITAYNLATGLTLMTKSGTIQPSSTQYEGTSCAAPITAGLIAVLLGIKREDRVGVYDDLNNIYDESGTRPSATKTKAYIKGSTFERSLDILQEGSQIPPYNMPFELNAIYNGARGPPIVC